MSTVVSKNVQIGADGTASNNFTAYQPSTPDGTLRIGNGNSGSVTDAIVLNSSGVVSFTNNPTLSGGTANGVAYLNGSKVLTSGSALTFDGTTFGVNNGVAGGAALSLTGTYTGAGSVAFLNFQRVGGAVAGTLGYNDANNSIQFGTTTNHSTIFLQNNAEAMRLTSTSLYTASGINVGIGTSSPGAQLQLNRLGTGDYTTFRLSNSGASGKTYEIGVGGNTSAAGYANNLYFYDSTASALRMVLDSSGNVGIGISSPAAPLDVFKASQGGTATFRAYGPAGQILWANGGTSTSYLDSDTIVFRKSSDGGNTERLRIDSSGNLGLGVTPSAWRSSDTVFQVGPVASLNSDTDVTTDVGYNYFYNSSNIPIYSTTAQASRYSQYLGAHRFFTAPSGTAGGTISFTQAMTLGADGLLQVGTTTGGVSDGKLQVRATGTGSGAANTVVGLNVFEETSGNKAGLWFGAMTNSNVGVIGSRTASGSIAFQTYNGGWGERARIDSSGHLIVPNGITLGTAVGTYADANTLDDYEEGTFTVFARDEDNNAQTYYESPGQYNRGHYVKIGQYVYFTIQMYTSGSGSTVGTQAVKITGLPFTAATVGGNGNVGSCTFPYFSDSSGGVGVFVGSVTEGGTSIYIQKTDTNGVTSAATITNWSTPRLSAVGWYRAAA
jgi:hypothetical protein